MAHRTEDHGITHLGQGVYKLSHGGYPGRGFADRLVALKRSRPDLVVTAVGGRQGRSQDTPQRGKSHRTGGQVATSYVGVKDAYDLSQDELARVRRARSNTEEALSLERDVRNARDRLKSTPCTCTSPHEQCAKRKAQDKADRLQRMERLVTGRT